MKRLNKMWKSRLGKILISFFGLLVLLASLTVVPIVTYVSGEPLTLRVYNSQDDPLRDPLTVSVNPAILGVSYTDETVLSGELLDIYTATENFYEFLDNNTVYATFTDDSVATIDALTTVRPSADVPYLEVIDIYPQYDYERSEAYQEETGEWKEFYQGINIRFDGLMNAIESRVPDLRTVLETDTVDVDVRVWRGRFVIVNP